MTNESEKPLEMLFAPYVTEIVKRMTGQDATTVYKWIQELPRDKRYIFRIVAGLNATLFDFDLDTLRMDARSLPLEDRRKIVDQLEPHLYKLQKTLELFR